MSLIGYSWTQEDLGKTSYAGKYVTHGDVNRHTVVEQVQDASTHLELGAHTLEYRGTRMDVRLDVNNRYAIFFYDENFERELGDQDFNDVIAYFLTPDSYKSHSPLHRL